MENLKTAVWIAHSLFERGKATGSSANMSFKEKDRIYITGSGTCFGTLKEEDFSVLTLDGEWISGPKPSKEFPLHKMMYEKSEDIQAVIHTHSFYATLWSCAVHENRTDCIPQYTPYLKMKLGTVGLVPYGKPGSEELFSAFRQCVSGRTHRRGQKSAGCLLLPGRTGRKRKNGLGNRIQARSPFFPQNLTYKRNQLTEIMSRKGDSHATMCCNRR